MPQSTSIACWGRAFSNQRTKPVLPTSSGGEGSGFNGRSKFRSDKGRQLECGYRLDLLVEETVIVELKCVEAILKVHEAQLMTYLRLTRKEVGLIINFNVPMLREGIVRKAGSASASSATLR